MKDIHSFEPLWGTWKIDKLLGSGGFGKVYKAVRREYGQEYWAAIKHISIPQSEDDLQRLYAEGSVSDEHSAHMYYERIMKGLQEEIDFMYRLKGNTNIVAYEDHITIPKQDMPGYDVFIRMELLQGVPDIIRAGHMTTAEVCRLGIDICKALELLEREKIVHRDIKPANILRNSQGNYKLGDFGVARQLEHTQTVMTRIGTLKYIAPEIYKGKAANATADIYSLGLVLHRLMNKNKEPFVPMDLSFIPLDLSEEADNRRLRGEAIPAPVMADAALAEIIGRACVYKPEERFQTAKAFRKALVGYVKNELRTETREQFGGDTTKGESDPEPNEQIKMYRLKAEQGDAEAQYNLGCCYDTGDGVAQDYKEAVRWYRLAAEQGHAEAQFTLGLCYDVGQGVEQDSKEVEKWFRLAAEQGHLIAQTSLGFHYINGERATRNCKEAAKWFELAAEQGNEHAQNMLGVLYHQGLGVKKDYKEAAKWYMLAAEQGHEQAKHALRSLGRMWDDLYGEEEEPSHEIDSVEAILGDNAPIGKPISEPEMPINHENNGEKSTTGGPTVKIFDGITGDGANANPGVSSVDLFEAFIENIKAPVEAEKIEYIAFRTLLAWYEVKIKAEAAGQAVPRSYMSEKEISDMIKHAHTFNRKLKEDGLPDNVFKTIVAEYYEFNKNNPAPKMDPEPEPEGQTSEEEAKERAAFRTMMEGYYKGRLIPEVRKVAVNGGHNSMIRESGTSPVISEQEVAEIIAEAEGGDSKESYMSTEEMSKIIADAYAYNQKKHGLSDEDFWAAEEVFHIYRWHINESIKETSAETKSEFEPDAKPDKTEERIKQYRLDAEKGNAEAQYYLGCCYYSGEGVKQDYEEAVKWYKLSAEQGYADAQYALGYCYDLGEGVKQNYKEAVRWYKLSDRRGNEKAQYAIQNLGDTAIAKWLLIGLAAVAAVLLVLAIVSDRKVKEDGECTYISLDNLGYSVDYDQYEQNGGKYEEIQDEIKPEPSDKVDQFNLGQAYYDGEGMEQNYEEAVKWYTLSAEQGYASAQIELGYCFAFGHGVEQNHKEAVKWFAIAAEQGHAIAQYNLGCCYYYGDGVEQDDKEAVKWIGLSAKQGNAEAQWHLGSCYLDGTGVEIDYKEAVRWFEAAAAQGNTNGQINLGYCYTEGKGVEQDYKEAAKWFKAAAEQGNPSAQYNLGVLYERGQGVEQDYEDAVKWFKLAAEQGDAESQYNLGIFYASGQGVEQDCEEAAKWFKLAAEQGDIESQYNLGIFYANGQGVEQDYEEAIKWLKLAAEQGDIESQYNIGIIYARGQDVEQDYEEAAKWFKLAADQGHAYAQFLLGFLYFDGMGVEQDIVMAKDLFEQAAANGVDEAREMLK